MAFRGFLPWWPGSGTWPLSREPLGLGLLPEVTPGQQGGGCGGSGGCREPGGPECSFWLRSPRNPPPPVRRALGPHHGTGRPLPAVPPWAEELPIARGGQGLLSTPGCSVPGRAGSASPPGWTNAIGTQQRPEMGGKGARSPVSPGPALTLPAHLQGPLQWLLGATLGQGGQQGLPLPNDLHAAGSVDLKQLRDTRGTRVTHHVTGGPAPRLPTCPTGQDDTRVYSGTQASCDRSACHGADPATLPQLCHLLASPSPPHPRDRDTEPRWPFHVNVLTARCRAPSDCLPGSLLEGWTSGGEPLRSRAARRNGRAGLSAGLTWMNRANAGVLARRAFCSRVLMLSAVGTKADLQSGPGHQAPFLEAPSPRDWAPGGVPQRAPPQRLPCSAHRAIPSLQGQSADS